MAGPWDDYRRGSSQAPLGRPDPLKAQENSRQNEELRLRQQQEARARAEAERSGRKTDAETAVVLRDLTDPAAKARAVLKLQEEAKLREILRSKQTAAKQILAQLTPLEQEYNTNFRGVGGKGNTPGLGSLLEYLPSAPASRFNQSSGLLSQLLKGVIRAPGEGSWSDADQARLDAISPGSRRSDASNETAFRDIRTLLAPYAPKPPAPARRAKVTRVK